MFVGEGFRRPQQAVDQFIKRFRRILENDLVEDKDFVGKACAALREKILSPSYRNRL